MSTVFYCERWFRYEKCAIGALDETKAKEAHNKRKPYTAVLCERDVPRCFVEILDTYIGVEFLDERLREYLSYQFQERKPGMLFLSMATHRQFVLDTDEVKSGCTLVFQEDGNVSATRRDYIADTGETGDGHTDVSGNWETYPEFGKYELIARLNRPGVTFPA